MTVLPLISIRVRNLPRNLHTALFSRNYLESRPWKSSPNDLRGGRMPSRLPILQRRSRVSHQPRPSLAPLAFFSNKSWYVSCSPATTYSGFTSSQDSTVNDLDHVELGLLCADICRALDQGTGGKRSDELSQSVYGAINQLLA